MGSFLKILLFILILYFIFSWVRRVFAPHRPNAQKQAGVRIFKKGDIEKPSLDMTEAETVDFEEIKEKDNLEN